jgi:hypothetical protein
MCRAVCGMSNDLRENQTYVTCNSQDNIELARKEKVSLTPRTRREQPSSILHATEVCAFCDQLYASEMERRCAQCDAPMCYCCAMSNEGRDVVCCKCEQPVSRGKR